MSFNETSIPQESSEAPEKTLWQKIKSGIAGFFSRKILTMNGPMNIDPHMYKNMQAEKVAAGMEASKFRVSDDEVYASALAVAKKFGWKPAKKEKSSEKREEGVPGFITNKLKSDLRKRGVSEEELNAMKPEEAWERVQAETPEKDKEKEVPAEEVIDDFDTLTNMWDEAYKKMQETSTPENLEFIENITVNTTIDVSLLEKFLEQNDGKLTPDEKHFVKLSIQMKKVKTKIAENLAQNESGEKLVSEEDFKVFTKTGEVREEILAGIADKIMKTEKMTPYEFAIYMDQSAAIEGLIRGRMEQ